MQGCKLAWIQSVSMKELKEIGETIQAFLTAAAIAFGAYWTYRTFIRTRQIYPRASTSHEVICRQLPSGEWLVRVVAVIRNGGDVLLSLVEGEIRLQQILPPPEDEMSFPKEAYEWPLIGSKLFQWPESDFEIEPSESDAVYVDFVCPYGVKTVQVYSHFRNAKKKKQGREIGWELITTHNLGVESFQAKHE